MGFAIKRADGSYRAWERGGPHLALLPGETREERDDMPTITNGPVGEGAGIDGRSDGAVSGVTIDMFKTDAPGAVSPA